MIIRPVVRREFVSIPNVVIKDKRLNADTRAMVVFLLSKPPTWQVKPVPLAAALSRAGDRPLGRRRLARMFREAMEAGYMARSQYQDHDEDGDFASYVYFVGMPEDVKAAVTESGVAILAQCSFAHARDAHARNSTTHSIKERKIEKTNYRKPSNPPLSQAAAPQAIDEEKWGLTEFGEHAKAAGMTFVFEGSKPYRAWLDFRGVHGMPLHDVVRVAGLERRGVWMPSFNPPDRNRRSAS